MQKLLLIFIVLSITACAKYPRVKVAEESMVQGCEYIETLTETTDPGNLWQYLRPRDPQRTVVERADNLGATHIIWVYDYGLGSAAVAYQCDP